MCSLTPFASLMGRLCVWERPIHLWRRAWRSTHHFLMAPGRRLPLSVVVQADGGYVVRVALQKGFPSPTRHSRLSHFQTPVPCSAAHAHTHTVWADLDGVGTMSQHSRMQDLWWNYECAFQDTHTHKFRGFLDMWYT